MASGWGVTAGGHTVYWARFVDGPISVSLVVVALGLLAGVDRTTLATGVGVGAYTMAVTLGATLVTGPPKLVWTAVAVGGFCALLWILWGPFTRAAREADWPGTAAFAPARTYATLLFVLYPVPWALGPGGFALAPGEYLLVVRLALDLALKVGFGVVVVRALSR
jgi:bacteriorhodopsin